MATSDKSIQSIRACASLKACDVTGIRCLCPKYRNTGHRFRMSSGRTRSRSGDRSGRKLCHDFCLPLSRRGGSGALRCELYGFCTLGIGQRVASKPTPSGLLRDGIACIAQSSSALGALSHSDRRLVVSRCVSKGMELVTAVSGCIDWVQSQKETRVIGLF